MEDKSTGILTHGPIVKTLLSLALPIMASSFLSTAYNICDMAWVGTLGAKAVAGVGVGGMFLWLSGGFATLPRMGGQVLTAQSLGSGKAEEARGYTRAAIQIIVLFAVLFAAVCLLFTKQLVGFFHLEDEISNQIACNYTRITCGFIIFSFLNLTLTGLYTSMGDSKTPLIANAFGLTLNMILDPLLIMGVWIFPKLEGNGAAFATVLSQAVVTLILLLSMKRGKTDNSIFARQKYTEPEEMFYYKRIFQIGAPASLQSMIYCMISMLLTRLIAGFGAEAVAVQRVGGQIESLSWNTADGFGSALNAFCGQNYGAGEYKRIRKGYVFSLGVTFLWGLLILVAFVFCPGPISRIFFHEETAIAISISYLFVIGFCEPFMAVELITVGALSGLGLTKLCSILSITITGMRIPLALILERTALGLDGIWWALSVTSIIKGILFTFVFLGIIRKEEKAK